MPSLSLGSVAGGNYVAPKTNWTSLTIANTTGSYLNQQVGWAQLNDIAWVNGYFFATFSGQEWNGTETYGIYYNANPKTNTTSWLRLNPNGPGGVGVPASNSCWVGYANSKWFFSQPGYIRYSSTIDGARTNTTTQNGDPLGREGYYGGEFIANGMASNGTRTVMTMVNTNINNSAYGDLARTDDGHTWTRILATPHVYYGRPMSDVAYLGNNTFVATVAADGQYHRSTNNGDSWTVTALPTPPDKCYKIASNGAGKAVIRGTYGLWSTTDYGATWTKTFTDPVLYTYLNASNVSEGGLRYPHSIVWSADDNCFVYYTGTNLQYYSDANGANWTQNTQMNNKLGTAVTSVLGYSPTLKYWLAAAAKTNDSTLSNTGTIKNLAWTDNIKGI